MAKLPLEREQCLVCGFDNRSAKQPDYALKCNYILHGRYLIGRILGQGGFGLTYIAWDNVLKIKVVVKEYFPMGMVMRGRGMSTDVQWNHSQANPEQIRQGYNSFLKEAQKMARVDQIASIVRVRDTFLDNETAYIIMDYVEGITLKQRLSKGGPMTFAQCLTLLCPMMEGLSKVHSQGIIHRDISPDNIMIQTDGSVKLLDLGAAKDMTDAGGQKSQLVAKKGFSPLEQYIDNGKIGPWTDVYALCATIYYCITGRLLPSALERMDNEQVVFPDAIANSLPPYVKNAFTDGLALRPERRIQSVEELLRRFYGQEEQNAPCAPQTKEPEKKAKWIWRAAGAVGGFFLICMIVVFAFVFIGSAKKEAKYLGNTNANMENGGGYAEIDKKYRYFTGADEGLYMSVYDPQTNDFNPKSGIKICDYGKYINIGKDYVFFEGKEGDQSVIFRMNPDGTKLTKICGGKGQKSCVRPQYVECADGGEYLYYLLLEGQNGSLGELYRYDAAGKTDELLMDKNISWYNVYGDSLYMIALENQNNVLLRANLDGGRPETLDDKNMYDTGFVEDDTMYLYSLKKDKLIVCNLDGEEKRSRSSSFGGIDGKNAYGYGDGWFYYVEEGNLCRMQKEGRFSDVVMKDYTEGQICCFGDSIWILRAEERFDIFQRQLFLAKGDGSNVVSVSGPVNNLEFETADESDFTYEDSERGDGVAITGYRGSRKEFEIPAQIGGKQTLEIKDEAFKNADVERVLFPEGLEKIGSRAFYKCPNLNYVGFPESLKEIGGQAFVYTDLAAIYIPAGVEVIGDGAFLNRVVSDEKEVKLDGFEVSRENPYFMEEAGVLFWKMEDGAVRLVAYPQGKKDASYKIPDFVTEIGMFSLCGTDLEEVTMPSSVQKISENAFYRSGELKNITVCKDCALPDVYGTALRVNFSDWEAEDASAFEYEDRKEGDGVIITGYKGRQSYLSIPEEIDGKQVKEIADEAFRYDDIVKAYLPDGLEKIGENAFDNCLDLEFISFPESLEEIGSLAFLNTNLASVSILSGMEKIGYGAFLLRSDGNANSRLKTFEVSRENASFVEVDGVLYEKMGADGMLRMIAYPQEKEDESYQIPENVAELWYYCFGRSKLKSVKIPSSVNNICQFAFAGCERLSGISVSEACQVHENQGIELEVERY